jgi:putative isomerase
MIPDAVHDEGRVTHLPLPVDADVTKPPITAWAAWKIYEMGGDRDFLDEIYEPLVRWNRWWFERNDDDRDGLCQYNHPYSSGWDDSPVWDGGDAGGVAGPQHLPGDPDGASRPHR